MANATRSPPSSPEHKKPAEAHERQNKPQTGELGDQNKDRADKNRLGGQTAGNRGNMDRGSRGE